MTTRKRRAKVPTIESTAEAWESGQLGLDAQYAKAVAPEEARRVDEAADLQMISIRLQKPLIDALKHIAQLEGLGGYQPLIRRVLTRFVDAEAKKILRDRAEAMEARKRLAADKPDDDPNRLPKAA